MQKIGVLVPDFKKIYHNSAFKLQKNTKFLQNLKNKMFWNV